MKADSRIFGQIEIEDDKIITLEKGMIGFPDLNHFALIYDEEKEKKYNSIMWLQSMDDPDIAFPVMMPHIVKEDYNPNVSEEMIAPLGKLTPENTYILVTVTVPKNIEDFSVNHLIILHWAYVKPSHEITSRLSHRTNVHYHRCYRHLPTILHR